MNYIPKNTILFFLIFWGTIYNISAQQKVLIKTNKGDVKIILYKETPEHAANFLKLVKENFYDSTLFHRVITNFMIQAGDPNSKNSSSNDILGHGGPGYTIQAEIHARYIHKKGALAAARQGDASNPERRSSGSQFYIVVGTKYPQKYMPRFEEERGEAYTKDQLKAYEEIGGTPHLDGQYTVFGEVLEGMEIVEAISNTETNKADRPVEDIYIIDMKILK